MTLKKSFQGRESESGLYWLDGCPLEPCTGMNSVARPVHGHARPGLARFFFLLHSPARPAVRQARPGPFVFFTSRPSPARPAN
jgi:hypothetical protein